LLLYSFPFNSFLCLFSLSAMKSRSFQHLPSFHSSHTPVNQIFLFSTFLEKPDEATTAFNFPLYNQITMFFSCLLCWRLVSALYFLFFCVNKHYKKKNQSHSKVENIRGKTMQFISTLPQYCGHQNQLQKCGIKKVVNFHCRPSKSYFHNF
jgi:hypothetical protein